MVVEVENAGHLLGEVRVLAGLPCLDRLPPDTGLVQDLAHRLGTDGDALVLGQVLDQLRQTPRRERPTQLLRRSLGDPADRLTHRGPNLTGRPPLHFGSNAANPCSLNAWITSRAYCGFIAYIAAASAALRPCTDASTIPARRSRTRSFVVRVIRTKRCISSGSSERTNTSDCRAITTSASKPSDSPPNRSTRHGYNPNVSWGGTSSTSVGSQVGLSGQNHPVKKPETDPVVARNRKAAHDYHLGESWEAGIVLQGTEVKALRAGRASLVGGFATVEDGEIWLHGVHIPQYSQARWFNDGSRRKRKLLLHRAQIDKIERKVNESGLTIVPVTLYFKDGRAKVEIALARGKKTWDKRHALAGREASREAERAVSRRLKGRPD